LWGAEGQADKIERAREGEEAMEEEGYLNIENV
jgi:hypothetical protein